MLAIGAGLLSGSIVFIAQCIHSEWNLLFLLLGAAGVGVAVSLIKWSK